MTLQCQWQTIGLRLWQDALATSSLPLFGGRLYNIWMVFTISRSFYFSGAFSWYLGFGLVPTVRSSLPGWKYKIFNKLPYIYHKNLRILYQKSITFLKSGFIPYAHHFLSLACTNSKIQRENLRKILEYCLLCTQIVYLFFI